MDDKNNKNYECLNTYISNSESCYKNREFYEALKQIDMAIDLSKNNEIYMRKKYELIERLNSLDDANKHYIGNKYEHDGKCNEAIIWYLKSKSLSRSLYRIGIIYYFGGVDIEKNVQKGIEYFNSAIKIGNLPAAEFMINYYIEKDTCASLIRAKKYLRIIERADEKKCNEYKGRIKIRLDQKSPIGSFIGYVDIYKFPIVIILGLFISFVFVGNEYSSYLNYKKIPVAKNINIYIEGEDIGDEKTILFGKKYEITENIEFKPFYAPEQDVEYVIDHEDIVSISGNTLMALKEGQTNLSMIHAGRVVRTIKIKTEKPKDIIEFGNTISKNLAYVGDSTNIEFNISNNYNEEIDRNAITITSSDKEVIEIKQDKDNQEFNAIAKKEGVSTLTIKYKGIEVSKDFNITGNRYFIETKIKSSKYDKKQDELNLKIIKDETLELSYKIKDNRENQYLDENVKVIIDNKEIVKKVDKDNKEILFLKGLKVGTSKVELQYKDLRKTFFIEVLEKDDQITVSDEGNSGINITNFDDVGEVLELSVATDSNYKKEEANKKIKVQAMNDKIKIIQNANKINIEALKSGDTGIVITYGDAKKEIKFNIKEATYTKSKYKGTIDIKVNDIDNSMNATYILKGKETKYFSDKSTKIENLTDNIIESVNLKVNDENYNDGEVNSKMSFDRYQNYLNKNPNAQVIDYNKANLILEIKLKGKDELYSIGLNAENSYTATISFDI